MIETSNQSLNIMKPPCRLWTWPPALKTACCPWCRLAQVICWIELFDLDSTCRNVSLATFQKISAPAKKNPGHFGSEITFRIKITLQNLFEHMIHMPSYAIICHIIRPLDWHKFCVGPNWLRVYHESSNCPGSMPCVIVVLGEVGLGSTNPWKIIGRSWKILKILGQIHATGRVNLESCLIFDSSSRSELAGWLAVCLAGWLAVWLSGCLAVWLSGWLSGCLAVWLAVCLSVCAHKIGKVSSIEVGC